MPRGLSASQKKLWRAIIDVMPPSQIGKIDVFTIREMLDAYDLLQKAKAILVKDPTDKDARIAWQGYTSAFQRYAIDFGLTPTSRRRFEVPESQDVEDDEVDSILDRLGVTEN